MQLVLQKLRVTVTRATCLQDIDRQEMHFGAIVVYDVMAWFDRVWQLKRSRGGKIVEGGDKIIVFVWLSFSTF